MALTGAVTVLTDETGTAKLSASARAARGVPEAVFFLVRSGDDSKKFACEAFTTSDSAPSFHRPPSPGVSHLHPPPPTSSELGA